MNFFPYGGLIEKLIFANKDKQEVKQIKKFLYLVSIQLDKIEDKKLDKNFLNSEEAYILFKRILEKVRLESRETKIHLFKNFLLKSMLSEEFAPRNDIDKEYILSKIETLDVEQFAILKWYFDNNFLESRQLGSEYGHRKKLELAQLSRYYKEFENDLMVYGLLEDVSAGRMGSGMHYYVPSSLGKVVYNFIKYDDI